MVRAELVRLKNGQVVDPATLRRSAQRKLGHTYSVVYMEADSEEVSQRRGREVVFSSIEGQGGGLAEAVKVPSVDWFDFSIVAKPTRATCDVDYRCVSASIFVLCFVLFCSAARKDGAM